MNFIMTYKINRILCLLAILVGTCTSTSPRKKICIIGAGVSGLSSVKQFSESLNEFEPIVFEKGTDIGGQWKYTDSTDVDERGLPVHSSMYKNLRTNGPKVLQSFPDYTEFRGENRSYIKHETVLEYLRNFTDQFDLRRFIKLNTNVEKINRMDGKKWHVTTRDLNYDKIKVYVCDAVMIANGHFTKPYSPIIPGLDTFTGRTLHSHLYRKPEEFANQTVAILGASFSGLDIGFDLSDYVTKVYLSHRQSKITTELPKNMIQIPGVVAANGSELILNEGSRVKADAFIICTGYLYNFPFLDESSGIAVTKGRYVHPLYKQFININHPTMVFIGLPQPAFPFFIPYYQTHYFISVLRGKTKLPSRVVMLNESQLPPGTPIDKAHFMEYDTFDYCEGLAKAAGVKPLSEPIKKAALIYYDEWKNDPLHFKENDILIHEDGSVEVVKPSNTSKV